MPTDLILNNTNFNDATLTNGKTYNPNGADAACNYPTDENLVFVITGSLGSKYITTSINDFQDLLGCDIQNNNTPVRKWLVGDGGQILEIDYVTSATTAVLKAPSSYSIVGVIFIAVDYWGSPQVEETILSNTTNAVVTGALVNTNIGPLSLNLAIGESVTLGSEPIGVDLGASAADCQLTVQYK